jgi:glycerophosphoryl diester phosphodiesterase
MKLPRRPNDRIGSQLFQESRPMNVSTRPIKPGEVYRDVWHGLRRGVLPLAGYEVLFKILAAGLFGPFSAWVLAMLISFTGGVAVSNQQILSFALSPLGMLTLLVTGVLGFFITFVEQAGLMAIASTTYAGKPCSAVAALWQTVRCRRDLLGLALLKITLYLLCFLPFVALAATAYLVWLWDHDINYYLAEKPPAFWRAAAVGSVALLGLLLACAWVYLRLMFALPACVLAKKGPLEGLKTSLRLTKGSAMRNAVILLIWLLIVAALGAALGALLHFVEYVAVGTAGGSLTVLILVLAGLVTLNVLTATVLSLVGVTTNALLIVRLYRHATQEGFGLEHDLPPAKPDAGGIPRWLSMKRLICAVAIIFLAGTVTVTYLLVEQIDVEDNVAVTAHRGSSLSAPENTVSAVQAAIDQGADFAEIDVQETADGVIVVLHDSDLMRTTGQAKKIWDVNYDQIRSLDAGSWFSPDFRGEPIPTLQQVIDVARGRIRLNVELKFNGHDQKLVDRVVQILAENRFQSQCVVSSLDYESLIRVRGLDRRLRIGHIVSVAVGEVAKLDVDFLSVHHEKVTPTFVRSLHDAGKEIHVWTVNDRDQMSSLVDLGVDNIITDDPETLRAVLDQRAEMSTSERILLGVRHWLAE